MTMTFSLNTRSHSEIGLVRKNNQDSGYVSATMLAVADGMGGAAAGDLASTVAIDHICAADAHREGEDMLTTLAGAVAAANDDLADLVAWDASLDGMGTTFCGAMFSGTQLGLVHIGDSRAYLLRNGQLSRLTHDHSWVQSLIDEGRITPQEAAVHPHRSLLLKVLNGQAQHSPDASLVDVRRGDRLLFCSDGLCGLVDDETIKRLLTRPDPNEALSRLVDAAHRAGGKDNITIIVSDVVAQDDELDAVEGTVIGAAATTRIPRHESTTEIPTTSERPAHAADHPSRQVLFDSEAEESMRYAPIAKSARQRFRSWLVVLVCIAAVLVATILGARVYLRSQYYVGTSGENVAIHQGVPEKLLWMDLHSAVEDSDIRVADLPRDYRNRVESGIQVPSVESGRATLGELRIGEQYCRAVRDQRARSTSTTPSAPATPPGSPSASATVTPSVAPSASSTPTSEAQLPQVQAGDCP